MAEEKSRDDDAPVTRKKEKTSLQTGITLRLGPDSKLSLPIQGSNLVMMLIIAGQLLFRFADLPDNVTEIKDDLSSIQSDIETLKTQGSTRDNSIGRLDTKTEILEKSRDDMGARLSTLENFKADQDARLSELERENEKLATCARRPSKCRL